MPKNGLFSAGGPGGPGRPKGAKNKLSAELKENLATALNNRVDDFVYNLELCTGKDYCDAYTAAARLIIPKDVEIGSSEDKKTIEDLLIELSKPKE